jgi:hypothetical protein
MADVGAGLPAGLRLRRAEFRSQRFRELKRGDVLVCARGSRLAAAVVEEDHHVGSVATENVLVVRLTKEPSPVLPEYLVLLLDHGGAARTRAHPTSVGVGYTLSPADLAEWPVPLLPLDRQEDLVTVVKATRAAIRASEQANRARQDVLAALAHDLLGPASPSPNTDDEDPR